RGCRRPRQRHHRHRSWHELLLLRLLWPPRQPHPRQRRDRRAAGPVYLRIRSQQSVLSLGARERMAMHVMLRMVALVFLFLLALPARAGGADGCTAYIDAAPVVADQPGTWCLTNDLRTDASHDYA